MAQRALESYDSDSDRRIAGDELNSVPGVKKYIALYDQDGDGAASNEELKKRFAGWKEQGLGLRRLDVRVLLDGRPLEGATVTFEPESYMSDWVKPATGITDRSGLAKISVSAEDLPEVLQNRGSGIRGVYVGTYKIRVTHPRSQIDSAYQTGSALGEEIARDTVPPSIQINLATSR